MKRTSSTGTATKPLTAASYIAACPKDVRAKLAQIRSAMRQAAPGARERTDYFRMPGYSYAGDYDYDGMFAWFSYKKPFVRVHIRPEAIDAHAAAVGRYKRSRGIVNFPEEEALPVGLVKKLVKSSVKVMKAKAPKRS